MAAERVGRIRVTVATARLLKIFLTDSSRQWYGYDLMRQTGFASGKLYPILARLRNAGWLVRELEDIDPAQAHRPARWMYCLTGQGMEEARYELAVLSEQVSPPPPSRSPQLQPDGGLG